ncbi:group-specific protein [Heyndrickxia sp. FSL W8-0496]|uniref:group-specific protein n=1 Tax=Heyndrickxia sp. FSL W8-0496 TaxID=2954702 RepID=UPI0030F51D16
MINVQIDEKEIENIFLDEVRKHLKKIESQSTFWDMKELCRQTNMSINFIKETFFYDPRFPKKRVGKKWLFPAKECEEFLLKWLKEQPN